MYVVQTSVRPFQKQRASDYRLLVASGSQLISTMSNTRYAIFVILTYYAFNFALCALQPKKSALIHIYVLTPTLLTSKYDLRECKKIA